MVKLITILGLTTYVASTFATMITVNNGCIYVESDRGGGKGICANQSIFSNCQSKFSADSSATFYACFDGNNKNSKSNAKCVLHASWPSNYGDVYFGADNCLYDSNGNKIKNQCAKSTKKSVYNPYQRCKGPFGK
ncbi:unnamed protein product [Cunninghamella echinulata]